MPPKKRIILVANTSWSIYRFRLHLLYAFVKEGFDVFILAPRDEYAFHFEDIGGVTYIELARFKSKSFFLLDDWNLYQELLQHYRRIRPDLIFHYTIKANVYGSLAAAKISCKTVAVVTGLGYMFNSNQFMATAASVLYTWAFKKVTQVWFLNTDDRREFVARKIVKKDKTGILPGEGVDTSSFYPAPYEERDEPLKFLLIARLNQHKGIKEFVEAAAILKNKKLKADFQLLGFFDDASPIGIDRLQLDKWTAEGLISYFGATHDVSPFIERADCIVLPSYREGMPLSLLEGASMCKALVATDVPGCRQIVKNGINGFLCSPKDPAGLAAAMEKYIMLSPADKTSMGLAGRQLAIEKFSSEKIRAIYLQQISTLINKKL